MENYTEMKEEEFEKMWQEVKKRDFMEAERMRQFYKEHPEALVELRLNLYDPFIQRMSDPLVREEMIEFSIVGISQTCGTDYDDVMKAIHTDGLLLLIPEPDNLYDSKAIAVYNRDRKIGYVMKSDIERIEESLCMAGYTECWVVKKRKNSLTAEMTLG